MGFFIRYIIRLQSEYVIAGNSFPVPLTYLHSRSFNNKRRKKGVYPFFVCSLLNLSQVCPGNDRGIFKAVGRVFIHLKKQISK